MSYFRLIYTCGLNRSGGIECDVTVNVLKSGSGQINDPTFEVTMFFFWFL